MKKIVLTLLVLLSSLGLAAQTRWVDARELLVGGHGEWESSTPYERLAPELKGEIRDALWNLGCNSSGIYVRFATNSSTVAARWTTQGNGSMQHMTGVGIKGVDLYFLNGDKWQYVNSGFPSGVGGESRSTIVRNMKPQPREYMLYLPLYETTLAVSIGVDSLAVITAPKVDMPLRGDRRPMVFYGTSIMQGACASRPGMNSSSILARRLGREAVNIGFSGNAKLDPQIAELIARTKTPYCFVLDFVPNCSAALIEEKMAEFVGILRAKHPKTPIVVVENSYFPPAELDERAREERLSKNKALRTVFDALVKNGDRNLHFVEGEKLIGDDFEATVDGLHATDLGFMRYADVLYLVLKKLNKNK